MTDTNNKPVKFVAITRSVLVKDVEGNTLYEGETNETKEALKARFGQDVTINYKVLYTTIGENQTYEEALVDLSQQHQYCYSLEEFKQWLLDDNSNPVYTYIAYSELSLRKQKKPKTIKDNTPIINNGLKGALSVYFYTSLSQLNEDKFFPIKGLSALQADTARDVLLVEDEERAQFIKANPNATEDQIKQQQVESVLILSGTPSLIDIYIKGTNLKWITFREGVEGSVKGLISSPTRNNHKITVLLLNVHFSRNECVMRDVGWLK